MRVRADRGAACAVDRRRPIVRIWPATCTANSGSTQRRREVRRQPASGARSERTLLLVGLSAAAGLIHAKATVDHAAHYWLFGVLLRRADLRPGALGVALYRRPDDRRWLMPAAVGSLAVVGVWLVSRSVGLPIGPWAGRPEPLAITDITATLIELLLAG